MDATMYYRNADGSLSERTMLGDVDREVPLPAGATLISEAEFASGVTAWQHDVDGHRAELTAAEQAVMLADFTALTAAGIPAATARRLAGLPSDTDPGGPPASGAQGQGGGLPTAGSGVRG
ncbi:hypothetical protein VSR01_16115 [Actinacidiphila sp. DG2A-62]|uniref:hypothetical protein n=1 Tax=Actinacidiphila sp. DG2A-62 TaxID=3108821 RepID=UPI002DBB1343|nr:hypothetical protein [Actinacidiphila sp. DG2A-62]MEC3994970.1 hypothetical protein [Actinacidiphila sp. DG2A-62]